MCYFKDSLALVLCTEEVVWYTMLIKFPYFVSIKFCIFSMLPHYMNTCIVLTSFLILSSKHSFLWSNWVLPTTVLHDSKFYLHLIFTFDLKTYIVNRVFSSLNKYIHICMCYLFYCIVFSLKLLPLILSKCVCYFNLSVQ